MDNKEFDEIFNRKLKETQSFEFDESDWKKVAHQLHTPNQEKHRGLLYLFSSILFLLLLTTLFLANSLRESKVELSKIKKTIYNIEAQKKDTTIQNITIFKYDTIRKSVIIHSKINQVNDGLASTFSATSTKKQTSSYFSKDKTPITTDNFYKSTKIALTEIGLNVKKSQEATFQNKADAAVFIDTDLPIKPIPTLLFPLLIKECAPIFFDVLEQTPERKKQNIAPNNLSIGILKGWSLPGKYSRQLNNTSSIVKKSNWNIGLQLSYQITSQLTGKIAVGFQKTNYQSTGLDSLWGTPPIEIPNQEEIVLNQLRIKQKAIIYQLGFDYYLFKNKKWQPYVGLSLAAQSNLKQTVEISFNELYNYGSYFETQSFSNQSFRLNSILPKIGLKVDLSNKVSWQLEAWFRQNINENKQQIYAPIGLNNVISYSF